jgi:hypothetical protein
LKYSEENDFLCESFKGSSEFITISNSQPNDLNSTRLSNKDKAGVTVTFDFFKPMKQQESVGNSSST